MPDLNVNVFRINRTSLKDPLMQFFCFFLSRKKRLQDTCENLASHKSYLVIKVKEAEIAKEVKRMACDVLPVSLIEKPAF